jgi:hypothetical protein
LLAHLDEGAARSLIIGLDAESPRAFFSTSVGSGAGAGEVGLILSWHGIDPAVVTLDGGRRLLAGHDDRITWIDSEALRIVSSRRLGGVFSEFLSVGRHDEIVVLHELGALRVNASGSLAWSVETDVVENFRIDDKGNLILSVMDVPDVVVSLTSGSVARP